MKSLEVFLNGAKCYCERKENQRLEILPGFSEYIQKYFDEKAEKLLSYNRKNVEDDSCAFELFYELMFDYVKKWVMSTNQ